MQHVCLCQHQILDVTSDSVLQVRPSHASATHVLLKGKQKFMRGFFCVFFLQSVFNCIFTAPHICIVLEPVQPDMMCTACLCAQHTAHCVTSRFTQDRPTGTLSFQSLKKPPLFQTQKQNSARTWTLLREQCFLLICRRRNPIPVSCVRALFTLSFITLGVGGGMFGCYLRAFNMWRAAPNHI